MMRDILLALLGAGFAGLVSWRHGPAPPRTARPEVWREIGRFLFAADRDGRIGAVDFEARPKYPHRLL